MPRYTTCAVCGERIAVNKTSRPTPTCRDCRWKQHREERDAKPHVASLATYSAGCRCPGCRQANTLYYGDRRGRSATDRPCRICGTVFVSRIPAQTDCSDACRRESRRMHHSTRRALLLAASTGEPVIAARIFERDGWQCHICRRRLSPQDVFPHRRAATIDHLIPLSKGGSHEPSNVKTACHACNAGKNNRGGNEQLLLIG